MIRTPRRTAACRPVAAQPPTQTVQWLIVILLTVVAMLLLLQGRERSLTPAAYGEPSAGWMGGDGVYAMTGQLARDQYGLYMMDTGSGTVWCYEYLPAKREFQLAWARSFRNDRYLENFANTAGTEPAMVGKMLERAQQASNRLGGALPPGEAERRLEETGLGSPGR